MRPMGVTRQEPVEHVEANVPAGRSHRQELATAVVPQREAWAAGERLHAVVIADVCPKTTQQTPARTIAACKRRLKLYDHVTRED